MPSEMKSVEMAKLDLRKSFAEWNPQSMAGANTSDSIHSFVAYPEKPLAYTRTSGHNVAFRPLKINEAWTGQ
jgi:hypothetical protein